jgi:hypothetical protein
VKILAAVGISAGGLLHLIGAATHRTYLSALRVDPGLFPKAADWTVINGYYATIDRFAAAFGFIMSKATPAFFAVALIAGYAFAVQQFGQFIERKTSGKRLPPSWLVGWRGDMMKALLGTTIVSGAIPLALVAFILFMAAPVAIGESAGLEAARRDIDRFKRGCDAATERTGCVELRKGTDVLVHGFPIESTDSHIAVFDVQTQRARAIERAGTGLLGDVPPAFGKQATPPKK